jgi:hypothetical protein
MRCFDNYHEYCNLLVRKLVWDRYVTGCCENENSMADKRVRSVGFEPMAF